jgi:hypothetical protein
MVVTACSLVRFEKLAAATTVKNYPEDGQSTFLRTAGKLLQDWIILEPRILQYQIIYIISLQKIRRK